jgi:cob(I)alamin adenosyltransferase
MTQTNLGLIQVYTGNGKGKTTAALGLALRAAGSGLRTFIGQFMKGTPYGELKALRRLAPLIVVEQFGDRGHVRSGDPSPQHVAQAQAGLRRIEQVLGSGEFDIVVMDEINTACSFGLLSVSEVLTVLESRPPTVEVILTGRNAPSEFVTQADLVTEMAEVRHPFRKGILARRGIEY